MKPKIKTIMSSYRKMEQYRHNPSSSGFSANCMRISGKILHGFSPTAYKYCKKTILSVTSVFLRSGRLILFRRLFSATSSFIRLICNTLKPRYIESHMQSNDLLIPYSLQSSATGNPSLARPMIDAICSSLKRLVFFVSSLELRFAHYSANRTIHPAAPVDGRTKPFGNREPRMPHVRTVSGARPETGDGRARSTIRI